MADTIIGGELLLVCRSHPRYEDGDILIAKTRRQIRYCHAQLLSSVKDAGFNKDGLRPSETLFEVGQQAVCKFKMERVSKTECLRTNLDTLEDEIVGHNPSLSGYFINVEQFIRRHTSQGRHSIFGTDGNEYWYDTHRKGPHPTLAVLTVWWQEIEVRTSHREVDHVRWPFTTIERQRFLPLAVDDFDDTDGAVLQKPIMDTTDPQKPVIVKYRKNWVQWRDLADKLPDSTILDDTLDADMREIMEYTRTDIVREKLE